MAVFITGTDTNVGKTVISAWLCLHMRAQYWKPIQTGSHEGTDSEYVYNLTKTDIYPETYLFKEPVSPHAAAEFENKIINPSKIKLPTKQNLVIEGAGGVMVPISPNFFMLDLISSFNMPAIVVARSSLGTINHTCLTLEALNKRNIKVLGVIMNGVLNHGNKSAIEEYGKTKVLYEFEPITNLDAKQLQRRPLGKKLTEILGEVL